MKHVDQLDTLSKYVVATQMVTNKIFPKDAQAYEHLKYLFKIRNKLVHAKSKPIPFKDGKVDSERLQQSYSAYFSNWEETVYKCYDTMTLCADALISISPDDDLLLGFQICLTTACSR